MSIKNISVIIPGGLNTDIIGLGVKEILKPGALSYGGDIIIGPGGKSRNIAQMISVLTGRDSVAMVGVTCRDPFNLWKAPIEALKKNGVNTDYIKIYDFKEKNKFPGIALIPVDKKGNNQIYVLPGINEKFCKKDIDAASPLFDNAKKNNGILALSLELPLSTAIYSIKKAAKHGLKVILDPGGINKDTDYKKLLTKNIFLIKPNEHEAEILTKIKVVGFRSAQKAANYFMKKGIKNVFITAGKKGGYFFNKQYKQHIPIPKINIKGPKDETGCGDQTTATLCAFLSQKKDIINSLKLSILAGTLQFNKVGIIPVTKKELNKKGKVMIW
jgi:ribokinase